MPVATEKLGTMATGGSVHTVVTTATKGMEFFLAISFAVATQCERTVG